MTLKKKILIGYSVVFAFMGFVVMWAIINLASLGKATDAILSENYRSIIAAENMVDALERQDSGILILFLGDAEKGITQFRENEMIFLEWLARAKDNITITGEAELIQSINADYTIYSRQFSTLTDMRHAAFAALLLSGNGLSPFRQGARGMHSSANSQRGDHVRRQCESRHHGEARHLVYGVCSGSGRDCSPSRNTQQICLAKRIASSCRWPMRKCTG